MLPTPTRFNETSIGRSGGQVYGDFYVVFERNLLETTAIVARSGLSPVMFIAERWWNA